MKSIVVKQAYSFRVDLAKTNTKGAFLCPSCGNLISPNDCTEKTYSILEIKMSLGEIEEIIICCKACGSKIYLAGFPKDKESPLIKDEISYYSHV